MDKSDINNRFITAVNTLLSDDKSMTKTIIAQSLEIKPSKFSEILNGRMNVGTDAISLLCRNFGINACWLLLGDGEMKEKSSVTPHDADLMAIIAKKDEQIDRLLSIIEKSNKS